MGGRAPSVPGQAPGGRLTGPRLPTVCRGLCPPPLPGAARKCECALRRGCKEDETWGEGEPRGRISSQRVERPKDRGCGRDCSPLAQRTSLPEACWWRGVGRSGPAASSELLCLLVKSEAEPHSVTRSAHMGLGLQAPGCSLARCLHRGCCRGSRRHQALTLPPRVPCSVKRGQSKDLPLLVLGRTRSESPGDRTDTDRRLPQPTVWLLRARAPACQHLICTERSQSQQGPHREAQTHRPAGARGEGTNIKQPGMDSCPQMQSRPHSVPQRPAGIQSISS